MGQTQKEWELSVVAERVRLVEAKLAFTMQVLNLTRNEDGATRSLETLFAEAFRRTDTAASGSGGDPPAPTGKSGADGDATAS